MRKWKCKEESDLSNDTQAISGEVMIQIQIHVNMSLAALSNTFSGDYPEWTAVVETRPFSS